MSIMFGHVERIYS